MGKIISGKRSHKKQNKAITECAIESDAEQSLAGDHEGRAKKWVAKCQGSLRPPFLSPEADREADA